MSKLDDIFSRFGQRNPTGVVTLTWTDKDAIFEAKVDIKALFLELIGEDELSSMDDRARQLPNGHADARNHLRASLRYKVEKL